MSATISPTASTAGVVLAEVVALDAGRWRERIRIERQLSMMSLLQVRASSWRVNRPESACHHGQGCIGP